MDTLVLVALLVALGYIILYIRNKVYLREGYQEPNQSYTVLDTSLDSDKPYVTNQDKYGDFEQDVVYQNEGGPDPTREAINMARRKFPFDWSGLPPSSSLFQAQQALFAKDATNTAAPFIKETFETIEAAKVLPPDDTQDQAEVDVLKAYQPKATEDMKSVDQGSVEELIQNIYGPKGFIAKVAKKDNNVYEVYELQEKNPKIVWEDELQADTQNNTVKGSMEPNEMLVTPDAVQLQPFGFGATTNLKRQSYDNYNPNLEGVFGPKMQWQQWG